MGAGAISSLAGHKGNRMNDSKFRAKMIAAGFKPPTYKCPLCQNEQKVLDGKWSGKNLQCIHCGKFSYFEEWRAVDGK